MRKQLRILIDMDGTAVDLVSNSLKHLRYKHPDHHDILLYDNIHHYKIEESFPVIGHGFQDYLLTEPAFKDLPNIDGSVEGIKELHDLGHSIFICTAPAMSTHCFEYKAKWFIENLPFLGRKIIISGDKTIIDADYLIDDHPEIIGENNPRWKQLLFNQPWNKSVLENEKIKRIHNWTEAVEYFKANY